MPSDAGAIGSTITAGAGSRNSSNSNRLPSGGLGNGILTLHLELRQGDWYPEADTGPSMKVYAFGEEGKALQASGPLIRVSEGTEIYVTIHNLLPTTAGVHGLHQHPGDAKAVLEVPSQETREMRFAAGAAGTYQYYASAGGNFFPRGYPQPTQHSRQIRTALKKAEDKKPGGWSTNLTLSD